MNKSNKFKDSDLPVSFEDTKKELLNIIEQSKSNPNIPCTCMKMTAIGSFELLEKITSNDVLSKDEQREWNKMKNRLEVICKTSYEADKPIYIDAEESWIQAAIDRLAEEMMPKYNKNKAIVFTTLQLYRWDRIDYFKQLAHIESKVIFRRHLRFAIIHLTHTHRVSVFVIKDLIVIAFCLSPTISGCNVMFAKHPQIVLSTTPPLDTEENWNLVNVLIFSDIRLCMSFILQLCFPGFCHNVYNTLKLQALKFYFYAFCAFLRPCQT